MRKFILIIILLFILNCVLLDYLKDINNLKKPLDFSYTNSSVLINKKELSFYSFEDFVFDDYFLIICSNNSGSYKYSFDNDFILVELDNKHYKYPYSILEKEKEIVTEIVYKEVYKPSVSSRIETENNMSAFENTNSYGSVSQTADQNIQPNSFTLISGYLSYPVNTDLGTIISGISSCFIADSYVSVDYSSLNPSCPGSYRVNLYTSDGSSYSITVEIL